MNLKSAWHAIGRVRTARPRWIDGVGTRVATVVGRLGKGATLSRPLRVTLAGVLGAAYGPMTVTILGVAGAMAVGLYQGRSELTEAGKYLLPAVFAVIPAIAWTLGYLAFGVGAIVGTACAAIDGGIAAGLEWALVAGIGAAVGIGVRYARLEVVVPGLVGGVVVGGAAGFMTWLLLTERRLQPLRIRSAIAYAVGLVLIAAYVWATFDWIVSVVNG